MNTSNPAAATFAVANPSDSILVHLARAALAPGASTGSMAWPKLDLDDAKQREFGDYELLEELGRGGMGVVYRARQNSLDREVAIKFIADWFADSTNVTRFLAEARAAARLLHPNIVPVHEVGSVEGLHYFSMPLIQGRSLAAVLDDGPMSAAAIVQLLLKLCDAMDYAHRLGLLHLDLKPANVLIDARNEPLIADFGLARHMDDKGGVDAQEVSGTPSFMAPEQILIKQYRLTRTTDVYALGAILYLCLTGESPHGEGAPDDILRRAVAGRVRPPRALNPKISRDLDAICMKCLELQPSDRYRSAAELADDLRRVRDGMPVSVRRVNFLERVQRWFRREPRLAGAVTFAGVALVVGAAATTWQWREALSQRDRAEIASEIGAHLFAYKGEEDKRAEDLINWLRKRLPGDENRQADALAAFAYSVNGTSPDATATLINKVVEVLGTDYRRQMIKALEAGSDPYRHFYAALLTFNDTANSSSGEFAIALKAALTDHAEDPLIWQVAAADCLGTENAPSCPYPAADAAEKLARLDPDNMYAWLMVAIRATEYSRAHEALREAAKRTSFNDYLGATYAAYAKAVEAAAVQAPPLIARPVQIIAPNERPELGIALQEAERLPIAAWSRLVALCGIKMGSLPVTDPQVLADCLTVGNAMTRSRGGLITQMIGVALVRNLAKGKPEAAEALRARTLYTFLSANEEKLSASQRQSYSSARWIEDLTSVGEMAAFQRRAKFFGLPEQPPADWKPEDPLTLLSGREIYDKSVAVDRDADLLVAQGKFADAIATLQPMDSIMRKRWAGHWLLVRYLTVLGKARLGQRDYAAAEMSLHEAWDIANKFGPTSRDARDSVRTLAELYVNWNTAEPSKGYDVKADEWRQSLATLEAAKDD
jgi:hypothetical protein